MALAEASLTTLLIFLTLLCRAELAYTCEQILVYAFAAT